MTLTGRITATPSALLDEEVLGPQFRYELDHLLGEYVAIEKALVVEYVRMGVITGDEASSLGNAIDQVTAQSITADRNENLSDIAFAVERFVEQLLPRPIPRWHVDRSRNDLQSCAQLMFGRAELLRLADRLCEFGIAACELAGATRTMPMPGYTHFQAAQVSTPGFYLAAMSEEVLHTLRRLLSTYDGIDACPLGSGAMTGQELAWDRDRLARSLGFRRVQPVALNSVASRRWVLEVTADLGILGVTLSRFGTDLLTWASGEYGFIDLPDELSGISSAMPQKKNFPVLERIRGRTAHLTAHHLDAVLGQRNTPYTNLVEVSKEAGTNLSLAFTTAHSVLRLFTEVIRRMTFSEERMRSACEREYLGGFSLANTLTLEEGVPWRQAQVIAGEYIVGSAGPGTPEPQLLSRIAAKYGHGLAEPAKALSGAFDVQASLLRLATAGSAHPDRVAEALTAQSAEYARLARQLAERAEFVRSGLAAMDGQLAMRPGP